MSFPAPPPVGLDTMGEVHDTFVPDALGPSAHPADELGSSELSDRAPMVGSALLGLAAGHRAMAPLAALALARPHRGIAVPALVGTLAFTELVVDKLPRLPARTRALPLVVRVLSGGHAAKRAGRAPIGGAVVGGAAAFAATELGVQLRLATEESMPRVVAALVEDVVAISLAALGAFLIASPSGRRRDRVRQGRAEDGEDVRVRVSA